MLALIRLFPFRPSVVRWGLLTFGVGVSSCVCDCCIVAEVIRCARVRTEYMALPPNEGLKHKELVLKADYDWVVKELGVWTDDSVDIIAFLNPDGTVEMLEA